MKKLTDKIIEKYLENNSTSFDMLKDGFIYDVITPYVLGQFNSSYSGLFDSRYLIYKNIKIMKCFTYVLLYSSENTETLYKLYSFEDVVYFINERPRGLLK